MKCYLPLSLFLWLAACSSPAAQNTSKNATVKKDSMPVAIANSVLNQELAQLYAITKPPYGLDTINALIEKLHQKKDPAWGEFGPRVLDKKAYASLSFNAKFTYNMVHPESYSQSCSILPAQIDGAHRIYGTLPDVFGEYFWSERQRNFFKNNRDSVMQLMKSLIEKDHSIGLNFKEAIFEINATEMVPFLIDFYNKEKKDHYVLTLLALLMKDNNYPAFMNSIANVKMYIEEDTEHFYSARHMEYNKINEDLIIHQATNFHKWLQAKQMHTASN